MLSMLPTASVSQFVAIVVDVGAASSACLTLRVSAVTLSVYDVLVHVTHLAVVCIFVHQTVAPCFVHFVKVCAQCQCA